MLPLMLATLNQSNTRLGILKRLQALNLAKNVFQVHAADGAGHAVLRKKLRRDQVLAFFSQLGPCVVAMEAPWRHPFLGA